MSSTIMEDNCDLSLPQKLSHSPLVHGWNPQPSFPPSDGTSHSSSSAVVTSGGATEGIFPGRSCCSLKEHDYIGMAEVSSAPPPHEASENEADLNLAETDLRLGLGPLMDNEARGLNKSEDVRASELKKNDMFGMKDTPHPRATTDIGSLARIPPSSHGSDAGLFTQDDANTPISMPNVWQNSPLKSVDLRPNYQVNGLPFPAAIGLASKNGCKRMYADTMVDAARESRTACAKNSPVPNAIGSGDSRVCASRPPGQGISTKHLQDDIKTQLMYPHNLQWSIPKATSVPFQNDCRRNAFHAVHQSINFSSASADKDGELSLRNSFSSHPKVVNLDNVPDEAPPAKGQVVGWPPVPSYRRSSVAARIKGAGEDGDSQSAYYVKVNMDGIPIGRKIDLIAYKSYEGLLAALEEMFHGPNSGHGAPFLKESDYVLTYEDKEGDWMLVGDVPWEMFVSTVRRLRISRGSHISGGGS